MGNKFLVGVLLNKKKYWSAGIWRKILTRVAMWFQTQEKVFWKSFSSGLIDFHWNLNRFEYFLIIWFMNVRETIASYYLRFFWELQHLVAKLSLFLCKFPGQIVHDNWQPYIANFSLSGHLLTTLQSLTNTKLGPHRFWPCLENGLIKTIPAIPHNLYVSFKSTSLYCGLG